MLGWRSAIGDRAAPLGRGWTRALPGMLVAAAFVGSRLYAYFGAGVRFEGHMWQRFWHFIDPALMQSRLAESLWFLHAQPPLPNAVLGLGLKLFGEALPTAFGVAFVGLGALATWASYALARRVGVGRWTAGVAVGAWCASPGVLCYENFLFYTYPVMCLVVLAALALQCAVSHRGTAASMRWPLAFVLTVAALALSRTLFHWVWVAGVSGLLLRYAGASRRLVAVAAIPLLLLGALLLNNAVVFGVPSASSWRGMNLARAVLDRVPSAQRRAWMDARTLSPLMRVGPFEPVHRYRDVMKPVAPSGVPLLDQETKSNGAINFHHRQYIEVARVLEHDARWVIEHEPQLYARAVAMSLVDTMRPATSYGPLEDNRARLQGYEAAVGLGRGWAIGEHRVWIWPLLLPTLLGLAVAFAVRAKTPSERASWWFVVFTVVWVLGVGALVERTENARFRFLVEPLLMLVAARAAYEGVAALGRRASATSSDDQTVLATRSSP